MLNSSVGKNFTADAGLRFSEKSKSIFFWASNFSISLAQ